MTLSNHVQNQAIKKANPRFTRASNAALPKFERGVSLLCWAYNEELLADVFLRRINGLLEASCHDYEIVMIDDCSTDRTNAIAQKLCAEIPQLRILRNERNMNVGYSCRRAIKEARKEFLFWQTLDWSYNIEMLRTFLELLKTNDIVAGVRRAPVPMRGRLPKILHGLARLFNIRHLTKRSDTICKALISVCNYCLVRAFFGVPLSDYQNVVFYRSEIIKNFDFESNSSFLNPELLIKSHWRLFSIIEVPISFIPRQAGEAKGTKVRAIRSSLIDVFALWYKWRLKKQREFLGCGRITRLNPNQWEVL